MRKTYWQGYYQDEYGLSYIEIYDGDDPTVYIRGELADDIIDRDDLHKETGCRFYKSLDDFGSDDWLTCDEVWPVKE